MRPDRYPKDDTSCLLPVKTLPSGYFKEDGSLSYHHTQPNIKTCIHRLDYYDARFLKLIITKKDGTKLNLYPPQSLFESLYIPNLLTSKSTITIPRFEWFDRHFSPSLPYFFYTANDPGVINDEEDYGVVSPG